MKKNFFTLSLSAISLLGVGAAIFLGRSNANQKVSAAATRTETPVFEGETLYDGDELAISAVSSSETDFSTSYQIAFSTGGNSIFDNAAGKFAYVLGYDSGEDGLISYAEDFQKKDVTEQDKIQEDIQNGLATTPVFTGYVFKFNSMPDKVFIPETISRGYYNSNSAYDVEIDAIAEHAFSESANVVDLYIPSTIETIPASAFVYAPNLQNIYCAAASKPAGWEDGWDCGKTVHWGEDIYSYASGMPNYKYYQHSISTKLEKVGNDNYNYIFGYVPLDETKGYYPLTVEYKIEGSDEVHWLEIEKSNEYGDYDSVGGAIGTGASTNVYSNSFYIDIETKKGEVVDFDSIVIHNIFKAKEQHDGGITYYVPDFENRYYSYPGKVFSKVSHLNEYITTQFKRVTNFAGFTAVTADVSKVKAGVEVYKKVKPYYYDMYEKNIKSGKAVVRYRLTQLGKARYRVDCGNGPIEINPHTPVIQKILKKDSGNNLGFVFKNSALKTNNYSFKSLKSFAIRGMTLTIDIVNDGVIIKTTAARARFGIIYIKDPVNSLKTFDADMFLILLCVGYTAGAALLSTVLFFVYKNVFKNDEFRRLKPKQFIKKAIIYWLTSLAVVLTISFIIIRSTLFSAAIVVFNPVDTYIVIFGIASIIIIGYFIKNFVTAQKARNQRKKAIKLGMVNEVADDGTK